MCQYRTLLINTQRFALSSLSGLIGQLKDLFSTPYFPILENPRGQGACCFEKRRPFLSVQIENILYQLFSDLALLSCDVFTDRLLSPLDRSCTQKDNIVAYCWQIIHGVYVKNIKRLSPMNPQIPLPLQSSKTKTIEKIWHFIIS